ncbi:MAG TPA: RNA polymerase sigma factor [Rhizomicrobium sp.]|jgi:RNA polymerase sigma-70 factor (ECF subfamily)
MTASDLETWFVREVLPLEAALTQFLRRSWRNASDIPDLLQEVYMRVCEAAQKQIPVPAKPFVFAVARNLIIDHVRREHVVSIESIADPDELDAALDQPGPDRSAIARDELRRLESALDRLPPRSREAMVMKKVEGLSRREIALRMGVSEKTVKWHLNEAVRALADILYGTPPEGSA